MGDSRGLTQANVMMVQQNAAGSLRVSLRTFFSLPQEWGIKGVENGISGQSLVCFLDSRLRGNDRLKEVQEKTPAGGLGVSPNLPIHPPKNGGPRGLKTNNG